MDQQRKQVALKIGGFAGALILVFTGAALAGSAIDPEVEEPAGHGDAQHPDEGATAAVRGLAVSQDGFTLAPGQTELRPDRRAGYSFRILDEQGAPVTDFDVTHERRLHLIVVRRDLTGFQHLHPEMATDGTWTATLDTSEPGPYRVFADFSVGGVPLTLGTDLFVPGRARARALPAPTGVERVDGYEVQLDQAADGSGLTFEVTRDGTTTELEPYLGAGGHLVALREHDLAFLHTHPEGESGGTGPVEFGLAYPSAGRYRMFFQFKANGRVHTAPFTVDAGEATHAEGMHDGGH